MKVKPQYDNLILEMLERIKKLERPRVTHNHQLVVEIDNGDSDITTGIKGDFPFDIPMMIKGWKQVSPQTGSITIDIWKDVYDNFPPTDVDSITAAAPVVLLSENRAFDNVLTDWDRVIVPGDILRFNVDSCSGIKKLTLILLLEE